MSTPFSSKEFRTFNLGNLAIVHINKVLNDVDMATYIKILEQLQENNLGIATPEQLLDVKKLLSMARKLNEVQLEAKS